MMLGVEIVLNFKFKKFKKYKKRGFFHLRGFDSRGNF